jgi:hypothetical protein
MLVNVRISRNTSTTAPTQSLDLLAKTTQEIREYLVCTIKNGTEFRNAFDPEDLGFDTIVQPPEPEDLANPVLVKC